MEDSVQNIIMTVVGNPLSRKILSVCYIKERLDVLTPVQFVLLELRAEQCSNFSVFSGFCPAVQSPVNS